MRRPEFKFGVIEIFEQELEAAVVLLGLAEGGLGVEIDVAENVFKFSLVGVFDFLQGNIDEFADVRSVALGVEVVEVTLGRDDEALAAERSLDALAGASVLLLVCLPLIF